MLPQPPDSLLPFLLGFFYLLPAFPFFFRHILPPYKSNKLENNPFSREPTHKKNQIVLPSAYLRLEMLLAVRSKLLNSPASRLSKKELLLFIFFSFSLASNSSRRPAASSLIEDARLLISAFSDSDKSFQFVPTLLSALISAWLRKYTYIPDSCTGP